MQSGFSDHVIISLLRYWVRREAEAPLSQVPVSASGEAHEEDICFQRQRLHAAVCPAGQEARVLVCCATGEVSSSATAHATPGQNAFEYRCK